MPRRNKREKQPELDVPKLTKFASGGVIEGYDASDDTLPFIPDSRQPVIGKAEAQKYLQEYLNQKQVSEPDAT